MTIRHSNRDKEFKEQNYATGMSRSPLSLLLMLITRELEVLK